VSVFFPAGCRLCNELLTGASRVAISGPCLASLGGAAREVAGGCVVPVPLHRQRERGRGYNQAALLSKALAKGCDCRRKPCC